MKHIHPDIDRLVFGCSACYQRAVADQTAAEVADSPEHHVTVTWTALGRSQSFKAKLRIPGRWPYEDVLAYYAPGWKPGPVLDALVDTELPKHYSSGRMIAAAVDDVQIVALDVGQRVRPPKAPHPLEGQPTLFG